MIIISYDISNNKVRTKFSKYLEKFGYRIQYSVFQIKNSPRVLNNVKIEIEQKFKPKFEETDSILIYHLSPSCKIQRYGYARHEDQEFLVID